MLRIDTQSETDQAITYALSGRLADDDLPALAALIADAAERKLRVRFDLGGVALVSREVVAFFARGPGRGAEILHCPDYVREWLRCSGSRSDRKPS
jgi:hypothetical protein